MAPLETELVIIYDTISNSLTRGTIICFKFNYRRVLRWKASNWVSIGGARSFSQKLSSTDLICGRPGIFKDHLTPRYPRIQCSDVDLTCHDFQERFRDLKPSQSLPDKVFQLNGRIESLREAGSRLFFVDFTQGVTTLQAVCSYSELADRFDKARFRNTFRNLKRGDTVALTGFAQRTPSGELSLRLTELPDLLSPCLRPMPLDLQDAETKIQNRHVDLRINKKVADTFRVRSIILAFIRSFLIADGHVEVQTPILADGVGGAAAQSFHTTATEFTERNINLRISPELWLKRLIVGGLDRIFELGPSFRNEGIDQTHNPEFTTCEFYRTFTDLEHLITMTEKMILGLANHVARALRSDELQVDVPILSTDAPFKRLDFVPEIERAAGCRLPDLKRSDADGHVKQILLDRQVSFNCHYTLPQLLDCLSAHYLEPQCYSPTWIVHHPECMSPLSKSFVHPQTGQAVSARGELFVRGNELVNTYEEENSPFEQRRKFKEQLAYRNHENEAEIDEGYLTVLEWGMPPTGGWGCGIDRLCMLMTGSTRISDVLAFGNLRNVVSLRRR